MKKYTMGTIGGGVLGQTIKAYYPNILIYDKFKKFDSLEAVRECDVIFICVPTPYEDGFDDSHINEAFSYLKDTNDTIVIIKSTVLPGTTDRLQVQYPDLRILFNPEFLTEKTSVEDFTKPDKQIVGYTDASVAIAEEILSLLPTAPYAVVMKACEAEIVKYAINSFYATKVIFGNFLYDMTQAIGADYDTVKNAFVSDKRITDSHFEIFHSGYRGFGGKCLPKDVAALIDLASTNNIEPRLLNAVQESNKHLRKEESVS